MKTTELYEKVTNTIIELLEKVSQEQYTFSWFDIHKDRPKNIFKNNYYTGINFIYLYLIAIHKGYKTNHWLTFFEIQQLQAKIKKGSKATEVIFYKTAFYDENGNLVKDENVTDNGKYNKRRVLKYFYVFNVDDVEGLPEAYYIDAPTKDIKMNDWEMNDIAEQIIRNTGAIIEFKEQNRAFYRPSTDTITLPIRGQFVGAEPFYATCFHELVHWTKHESRCNRKQSENRLEYAYEELVAELGAAFLCSHLNFEKHLVENAIYIQSWLKALKNDTQFIFKASAQAQRAADYILQFENKPQEAF